MEKRHVDRRLVLEQPTVAIAWDPEVLTAEEYTELVAALGDLVRAHGGEGVQRLEALLVDVRVGVHA